jgi:hypothetical protein
MQNPLPALMEVVIAFRRRPGETGFFDLTLENREQVYRHLIIDRKYDVIPIHLICPCTSQPDRLAISPRSLSAQLLRTCHQVLDEAYCILYTENNFVLYMDKNITRPRSIPLCVTSGNVSRLHRIAISIQSVSLLKDDLQDLLDSVPLLQVFGIDGNLLRTIDFHRPMECGSDTAIQRCLDQSIGLLLLAFGGKELFRRFLVQNSGLTVEYTFGLAVDLILPATGEMVKGLPQVSFIGDRHRILANRMISGIQLICVKKWKRGILYWSLRSP